MPEIIEQYYAPLLKGHGFIPDPDNQQYGSLGISWKLSPEIGESPKWLEAQSLQGTLLYGRSMPLHSL